MIVGVLVGFVVVPALVRPAKIPAYNYTLTVTQPQTAQEGSETAQQSLPSQTSNTIGCSSLTFVGQTETYDGRFYFKEVSMACSGANCPRADRLVFYLVTGSGAAYHLLFSCVRMPMPSNGTYVRVTGAFVTPSAWNATAWYPLVSFDGDIVVQTMQAT
jgi:hypothetical protein